ncbi:MAG: hypothetical protein ACJ8F7_20875 [Gemmataceae bacterium]
MSDETSVPPPEDLPYPPKGDKEGWNKWWDHHNDVWGAYWSATGLDPAGGLDEDEDDEEEPPP